MAGPPWSIWMFEITIKHKSSCNTLYKNITNFLFCVLWIYLTTSIKNNYLNLWKLWCPSAYKKWIPFLTSFLRYCKDVANLLLWVYFEYFENAWSCPAGMIVAPCRHPWYPKCWNQLVGNFDVYLHAKINFISNFFFEIL